MESITPFQILESKIKHDYIWLAVAMATVSLGVGLADVDEHTIIPRLALFLITTGGVFGALLIVGIWKSSGLYMDWHAAHLKAFKVQAGLAQPVGTEPAKPQTPSRVDVYLNKKSENPNAQTEIGGYDPNNKPPREFVLACFDLAQKSNKWRVSERAVEAWLDAHPEWARYDDYLSAMEQAGILVKEWNAENAPRIWNIETIQLDVALEIFGYKQ